MEQHITVNSTHKLDPDAVAEALMEAMRRSSPRITVEQITGAAYTSKVTAYKPKVTAYKPTRWEEAKRRVRAAYRILVTGRAF